MSRSAMSLTAAVCGFLHLLLTATVVQCQNSWDVKCRQTYICAVIGSTVEVSCTYSFPTYVNNNKVTIKEQFWFRKVSKEIHVDLRSDPDYSDRVEYECGNNNCLLRIKDVRESDSAEYKFRFTTNQESGKYNGPAVTLSVTGLQVQVRRSVISGDSLSAELQCDSRCPLPDSFSYTWMKNQQILTEHTSKTIPVTSWYSDTSVSCGVTGQEYRSPAVLLNNHWEVNYAATEICALKGSTVEISCSYRYPTRKDNLDITVIEAFWFIEKYNSVFMYLRDDRVYSSRVRYGVGKNNCTLMISDLRESDSAVYKFRFITNQQGGSFTGQPGVKLSVTDPRLQIRVRKSIFRPEYLNWIELTCQSNCQLSDRPSYIWYKNGQMFTEGQKNYVRLQTINSADRYHCAIKHHELFPSSSVYGPNPPIVLVSPSGEILEGSSVTLTCRSYANPAATYTWYKKEQFVQYGARLVITSIQPSDSGQYFCLADSKLWRSQSDQTSIDVKYAPKHPSVSVSPPGEIVEGSSVTLTCSSDANPAATYTWYKGKQYIKSGMQLVFTSINPNNSGQYSCLARNHLKKSQSHETIDVKYAPKHPSVSVSPSGEIVEGSSVTLTCSSDANPAANYTWYKGKQTLSGEQNFFLKFTSISYKDRGNYYCRTENQYGWSNSTLLYLDVQYAPKLPSVSVSPSGEIVEGSSVTLTCSSDANPAANYIWYKDNEDSPKASGQTFTINDSRTEHSGVYYCVAQNGKGLQKSNSTVMNIVPALTTNKLVAVGLPLLVVLLTAPFCAFLLIRKWKTSKSPSQPQEEPDNSERHPSTHLEQQQQQQQQQQEEDLNYASIRFVKKQTDPIYSNMTVAGTSRHTEKETVDVEYDTVKFHQASSSPRRISQVPLEDPSALYSTVKKI